MTKIPLLGLLISLSTCAVAQTVASLPSEVERFIERRELCDHFRGEIPGDNSERAKEVNIEIAQHCRGTDRELLQLRKKYANHSHIFNRLSAYENCIESSCDSPRENR